MAKRMNYRTMANADVENMTVKQLKNYIREVTSKVGNNLSSHNKAIASASRGIIAYFGTYRRNNTTYIKMGMSGARKAELVQKAQRLRSFATTVSDRRGGKKLNPRAEKAYQKFTSNEKYKNTSRAEWEKVVEMVGELQGIFEEYGSTIINLYYEYRNKGATTKTIVDLIYETRNELLEEGKEQQRTVTKQEVIDRVAQKLRNMFK